MSRTIRRNKKHLITSWVGTRTDYREGNWRCWRYRGQELTPDQAFERSRNRFRSDAGPRIVGEPRWYRHLHGSHKARRVETSKIHRCIRSGEWEGHYGDSRSHVHTRGYYN